jgi:hypothetical protein
MQDIIEKIGEMEAEIEEIKQALQCVGPIRPGNLTRQYRNPKEKKMPYWQLSYTYRMKSYTQYVRKDSMEAVRAETENYRKYKALTDRWVELGIEISKFVLFQEKSYRNFAKLVDKIMSRTTGSGGEALR